MIEMPNSTSIIVNDCQHTTGSNKIKINSNGSEVLLLQFQSTTLCFGPDKQRRTFLPSSYQPFHAAENSFVPAVLSSKDQITQIPSKVPPWDFCPCFQECSMILWVYTEKSCKLIMGIARSQESPCLQHTRKGVTDIKSNY